jgi:hypothetical protein
MVSVSQESEDVQLDAVIGLIEQTHMAQYLKWLDGAQFAFHYQGQDFQKNTSKSRIFATIAICQRMWVAGMSPFELAED